MIHEQCQPVSPCVKSIFIYEHHIFFFNPLPTFSPLSIIQHFLTAYTCQILTVQNVCPPCLFAQGCGRGSSARRGQICVPSWGRNTPKWWWCTEQVKKKKKSLSQVVLLRTNKCIPKQFELWNAFNICEVQPAFLLFITVCLMINLTLCSYFMYHLKATTRQSEFLLWQQ